MIPVPFPETVLSVITTVDSGPFALIPTLALRIRTVSKTAIVVPVPDVVKAFIAALAKEKNSDSVIAVMIFAAGFERNDESVRMP